MRYDPEAVLQQASLDAASVVGFLSENYPQFIADAAVDDLAAVAAYLSDAGGEGLEPLARWSMLLDRSTAGCLT